VGIKIEKGWRVNIQYKILVKIKNQQNTSRSRLKKRASLAKTGRPTVDKPDLKEFNVFLLIETHLPECLATESVVSIILYNCFAIEKQVKMNF